MLHYYSFMLQDYVEVNLKLFADVVDSQVEKIKSY